MFAIIAILSDIPAYIAALVSKITGADTSAFIDFFNNGLKNAVEALEQIFSQIR